MVWVLRSRYGVSRDNIKTTIARLRETRNVVSDSAAVESGLAMLEAEADFAGGLIAHEGRWLGGETFVSFDNKAVDALAKAGTKAKARPFFWQKRHQ